MGTFGSTNTGGGNAAMTDTVVGTKFNFSGGAGQEAVSITAEVVTYANPSDEMRFLMYLDSDKSLIDETEEVAPDASTTKQYTLDFASPPALIDGEDYYLMAWADSNGGANLLDQVNASYDVEEDATVYNGAPNPLNPSTETAGRWSNIYCTYQAAAGGPTVLKGSMTIRAQMAGII